MEKPKNSRIKYPILTRYEKKYRKKVEKICPACGGHMNEDNGKLFFKSRNFIG